MNKITKVLKAIFFSGKFSTEWRKNNLHNFTTPVTKFKMDAVKVGKGTYGKLFVVTRLWFRPSTSSKATMRTV